MHIGGPADRPGVPQSIRGDVDRFENEFLTGFFPARSQMSCDSRARAPGAEVFGREMRPGSRRQVVIDVGGSDGREPVPVLIAEQSLSRQILTPGDQACEASVLKGENIFSSSLARELEVDVMPVDFDMVSGECCQPVRIVGIGILAITDPDESAIEDVHSKGDDLVAGQPAPAKVSVESLTQAADALSEFDQSVELDVVT